MAEFDATKMVKAGIGEENPKSKYRNPKQIKMIKIQMTKRGRPRP